eukprot:PhM_4_TR5641/c0_g1_i1/m.65719
MGAVASIPHQHVDGDVTPHSKPIPLKAKIADGDGHCLESDAELIRQTRPMIAFMGEEPLTQAIMRELKDSGAAGLHTALETNHGNAVLRGVSAAYLGSDAVKSARTLSETVHVANSWQEEYLEQLKSASLKTLGEVIGEAWSPAVSLAYEGIFNVFVNCWLAGIVEHCQGQTCACHCAITSSSPLAKSGSMRRDSVHQKPRRRVTVTDETFIVPPPKADDE